ncbi:MAG: hypothetical protein CL760_01385 [Chloroflexi bacterium]|nr:hypothetical protein [Chloroflexota bacterium]|tara:strand:+ start:6090 stop:6953 length:864 start_codon:yes stop_codon:yes gene_type:complete
MRDFYKQLDLLKEKEDIEKKVLDLEGAEKSKKQIKEANILVCLGISLISAIIGGFYYLYSNYISIFAGNDSDALYIYIFNQEQNFIVLLTFIVISLNIITSLALTGFNYKHNQSIISEYEDTFFTIVFGFIGFLSTASLFFSSPNNTSYLNISFFVVAYSIILTTRLVLSLFKIYFKKERKILFSKYKLEKARNDKDNLDNELNANIEKIMSNKKLISELFNAYKTDHFNDKKEIILAESIFQESKNRLIEEEEKAKVRRNRIKMFEKNVSQYCNIEMEDVCTIKND